MVKLLLLLFGSLFFCPAGPASPLPRSLPHSFPLLSSPVVVAIVVVVTGTICYCSSSFCFAPLPQKPSQHCTDACRPSFLAVAVAVCSSLSLSLSLAKGYGLGAVGLSGVREFRDDGEQRRGNRGRGFRL